MRYFTWKLKLVSNIMWLIVDQILTLEGGFNLRKIEEDGFATVALYHPKRYLK